ncbi:netrin receptor UNC5B-a-like [Branchiostoma floridae x Branchiostoma belcheri]
MRRSTLFGLCALLTFFAEDSEGQFQPRHGFWADRRRRQQPVPVRPVDCVWSRWCSWTACSAPCGNSGRQTRTRFIAQLAANGGRDCFGSYEQTRSCNQFCYNGGSPVGGGCRCVPGYTGTCCATLWRKEGTCSSAGGSCRNRCQTDWDCPGRLLCCPKRCSNSNWAAHVCKEPVLPATQAPQQQQAGNGDTVEILKIVLPSVLSAISLIAVAIIIVRCRPNIAVSDSSTTQNNPTGGSSTIAEDAATIVGLATMKNGEPPPYTERASMTAVSD